MAIELRPITPNFAAEATGIDLRQPLSDTDAKAILAGMDQYAVLIFHDQPISDEEQLAFTQVLGPLAHTQSGHIHKPEERRLGIRMADVSNLDKQGRILARDDRARLFNLGNRLWHSDLSFREVPAKFSLLSARAVPSKGGNTEFADMTAAYAALDAAAKAQVEDLVCEHSLLHSRSLLGFTEFSEDERKLFAPVCQRLVRTHPATGAKSLYLASHAGAIVGWPVPEARAFLRDLIEHATRPEFVHVHQWRAHDLVIWDNRRTMHRVRRFNEFEEVRDVRRTTIAGDAPTVEQAA